MTLEPLLTAAPAIQIHAFAAMIAFGLGVVQFVAPKGTLPHRTLGWIWVAFMFVVSATAFFIHEIRLWGPWSPIHIFGITTPIAIVLALRSARRHNVNAHRIAMYATFFGALLVAGAFTFLPGRIMYLVVSGTP